MENLRLLMVQQDLQDDAGRDRDQYVVAARLNPVIPARRRAQPVRAGDS